MENKFFAISLFFLIGLIISGCQPRSGELLIKTQPAGAMITIENSQQGITPITIQNLIPGEHTISISLSGYLPVTKTVTIEKGQQKEMTVELKDDLLYKIINLDIPVDTNIISHEGILYVGSGHSLYGIDVHSEKITPILKTPWSLQDAMFTIYKNKIYIGFSNKAFCVINMTSGEIVWQNPEFGEIKAPPLITGNMVFPYSGITDLIGGEKYVFIIVDGIKIFTIQAEE